MRNKSDFLSGRNLSTSFETMVNLNISINPAQNPFAKVWHKINSFFGKWGWLGVFLTGIVLLLLCSCDSQKSSLTNIQEQGSEASRAKRSSDFSPPESIAQPPGFAGKESEQNVSEKTLIITKFQLMPEVINNIDSLKVVAEGSGGEGEVTFLYEWRKNGEPAGESSTLSGFKRGDKISLKVTPYDGKTYGPSRTFSTEIQNLPPKITEHKDMLSSGKVFSYKVMATDPDGDTLTYALKSAPQGMTIDSATGMIRWNVPADFKGRAPITVSVSDGHGGETMQSFSLEIRPEAKR